MKVDTTRFGEIEVWPNEAIVFPEGILGFPSYTKWAFVRECQIEPFRTLQSLEDPKLAFVIVPVEYVVPGFGISETKKNDRALDEFIGSICFDVSSDPEFYAIVCMAKEIKDITVNLQGPLIIGGQLGGQFVVPEGSFSTRESFIR